MAKEYLQNLSDIRNAIKELQADNDYLRAKLDKHNRIFGIIGYDDLFLPMDVGKIVPAVAAPTWAVFTGNIYKYTFAIGDRLTLPSQEFLHGYKEGTDFELHVHIATNSVDGTDRYVRYQIEYTFASVNAQYPVSATANTADILIPANTVTRTHIYATAGVIAGTGLRIGAGAALHFTRIALAGGGAAPSANPFVPMVGIHIEKNSIGSRTTTDK